jgi:hypothetical protein
MSITITKPEPSEYYISYLQYINMVPGNDLMPALKDQKKTFASFIRDLPAERLRYSYAEGKWTAAEVIQHLIDTERIYMFRMLNFVRHGMMDIPGFDQDSFVRHSQANTRSLESFVNEFNAVREGTITFLETITQEDSKVIGKANNYQMSVRTLGFVTYGHVAHHLNILMEKYLNS